MKECLKSWENTIKPRTIKFEGDPMKQTKYKVYYQSSTQIRERIVYGFSIREALDIAEVLLKEDKMLWTCKIIKIERIE